MCMVSINMKCKCGKEAAYSRKYEGNDLCKSCLIKSIESKAKRTIRKYKMLDVDDKIAVAFSGGKDSSSVLYILHNIVKPRRDMELFAILIDEGSGEYRKKTLGKAKGFCKKLGIKYIATAAPIVGIIPSIRIILLIVPSGWLTSKSTLNPVDSKRIPVATNPNASAILITQK